VQEPTPDYAPALHDASTATADQQAGWTNYQGIAVRPGINVDSTRSQLQALSDQVEQEYGYGNDLYNESDLLDTLRHTGYDRPDTLESMYDQFLQKYRSGMTNTPGGASPYSTGGSGGSGGGGGTGASGGGSAGAGGMGADGSLQALLAILKERDARAYGQQEDFRKMLMSQLGSVMGPLDASSPGIRQVLDAQRFATDRGVTRQRRDLAERRAYDGSGGVGSGGYDTDIQRIQERATEQEAAGAAGVMHQELQNRRTEVSRLLTLAMSLGDSESARLLQGQLAGINSQLSQGNFYDDLGYRYNALTSNANSSALAALLGMA
jgi:hypothetical protein